MTEKPEVTSEVPIGVVSAERLMRALDTAIEAMVANSAPSPTLLDDIILLRELRRDVAAADAGEPDDDSERDKFVRKMMLGMGFTEEQINIGQHGVKEIAQLRGLSTTTVRDEIIARQETALRRAGFDPDALRTRFTNALRSGDEAELLRAKNEIHRAITAAFKQGSAP